MTTLKVECILMFLVAIVKKKESWRRSTREGGNERRINKKKRMVGSPGAVWKE